MILLGYFGVADIAEDTQEHTRRRGDGVDGVGDIKFSVRLRPTSQKKRLLADLKDDSLAAAA
jgi:hypothetical protein